MKLDFRARPSNRPLFGLKSQVLTLTLDKLSRTKHLGKSLIIYGRIRLIHKKL